MEQHKLQTIDHCAIRQLDKALDSNLKRELSEQLLRWQNSRFSGTLGVSKNNRGRGFLPAFHDTYSGVSVLSRFTNGQPAPVHILDGLPRPWITSFDENGAVATVREGVIAGFIRAGRFYTRDEAVIAH